jgi:hypothetical protein
MENNKITQEELEELNKFRLSNQQLIINFGQLEIELQNINFQKQYLISNLESLKKSESTFLNNLQKKYGDVNIDPDTGEFVAA